MCGCKDCKEVTLLNGTDGRGIVSITRNGDGTFTYLFTDGTIYVTPNLTGAEGPQGETGPQGPQGEPGINGNNSVVEFITAIPGPSTSGDEPAFSWIDPFVYTVPALTPTADYEVTFTAAIAMTFDGTNYHGVFADIYKNGASIDPACIQGARAVTLDALPLAFSLTTSVIISLAAGDDITIYSTSSKPSDAYLQSGIFKVIKLG
jgi:hypothetical protein